jgi:glucokinase
MILAGDIGGTHTRLAIFREKEPLTMAVEKTYRSREFRSLGEIAHQFLKEHSIEVKGACFGVAGPVRRGRCQATNLPWVVDERELATVLNSPRVKIINDLEANAHGVLSFDGCNLKELHVGQRQEGNRALIAAGTGLGEAGIFWNGCEHVPFACEGGHVDFAPRDELEIDLWIYLKRKFNHISFERVISGPGLLEIYHFLVETGRAARSEEVIAAMKAGDPSRVVSEYGMGRKDAACSAALDHFISLYGSEAGNLALKFLALGGIYVGGGIAPQIYSRMKEGGFHEAFINKGRFQELLSSIPIYVVMNDKAALMGAACVARKL